MEGRSVEASGRTVDEAVGQALARLGLELDQVQVEVLREGKRGILGIGAEDALVRVTEMVPEAVKAGEVPAAAPAEAAPEIPPEEPAMPEEPVVEEGVPAEVQQVAQDALGGLLQAMRIRGRVEPYTRPAEEPGESATLVLNITGDDLGLLIGRRGETLNALQFVTRLMLNRQLRGRANILVDVEGYTVRREQSLRQLAQRMAEKVSRDGRTVYLEPMSAYERRIVHLALRDHPTVTTYSVGEGDSRKVTIRLKR